MSKPMKVKTGGANVLASCGSINFGRVKLLFAQVFSDESLLKWGGVAAPPCPKRSPPTLEQITRKRNQSGEFVAGVNVFLDDVKSEIVKPAKTPHCQRQQHDGFQRRAVEEKQNRRDNSYEQK
jgi:hypothetical protein